MPKSNEVINTGFSWKLEYKEPPTKHTVFFPNACKVKGLERLRKGKQKTGKVVIASYVLLILSTNIAGMPRHTGKKIIFINHLCL